MPSALETLVKILKLEQGTDYQDKAVIGGLKSFASHWAPDAHVQAKKPEHHALIDELSVLLNEYETLGATEERYESIKYMLGRITGRVPPRNAPPPETGSSEPESPPREPEQTRTRDEWLQRSPAPQDAPQKPQEPFEPNRADLDVEPLVEEPQAQPEQSIATDMLAGDVLIEETVLAIESDSAEVIVEEVRVTRQRPGRETRPPRRRRNQREPGTEIDFLHKLQASVGGISGIGPKMAEKLEQLGVYTIEDLLYLFPRRYDDYTRLLPLNRLQPDQMVTVIGTVRSATVVKGKRGVDVLKVTIDDGAGLMTANFFGQPYLRNKLERGVQVVFSGKTDLFLGKVTMNNPEWELLEREALHTRSIVPIYPLTKGLSAHNLRKFTRSAVEQWTGQMVDYMPDAVLERTDLPELGWSLHQMHFPGSMEALEAARRRLTFDELILLQLSVLRSRREWQSTPAEAIQVEDEWLNAAMAALPYTLTGAQSQAIQAIRTDLALTVPMNRLLQGDVGAGKTVVAALAMAVAVNNGFQAGIMAPTSILAEQHYQALARLIHNLPGMEAANIKLLTSGTSTQERGDILWGLGEGSVHVVIGTHALLEERVNFHRLGLAVIDEQHRFGVEQRGRLRGKGHNPHVLVMTATPIPRTLALTLYADLDLTVLDEMPPGRTPVDTRIIFPTERERVYGFIKAQLDKGRQAFIVYPLVEASESETLSEVGSAVDSFEQLRSEVFPKCRLGLLHGRMSPAEKDATMASFSAGEIQVLVCTSVVEVGIDVPNATVMLIEGANRFGLAQLHQFRGRVGRGEYPSYCLLIPDDARLSEDGYENERLRAMESTTDGFKLAEVDWNLRGAGDLLGTRQSGGAVRMGEYMDPRLVAEAQTEARTIYEEDPGLALPEHATLRETLRLHSGDQAPADVS